MSAVSWSVPFHHTKARSWLIPIAAGVAGTLGMLAVYLALLSVLQSPSHAFERLASDGIWVSLVSIGFGAQIGLYTYLRLIVHAAKAAGATAMAGAGTGTSTLGMLACCAHHLSDIAPLVALTGTTGLSGTIGFFTEWKYALIALGLAMNLVGMAVTGQAIRKSKQHLDAILESGAEKSTVPACH